MTLPRDISSVENEGRKCLVCGRDITQMRSDARTCGGGCRAKASRLRAEEPARGFWDRYGRVRRRRPAQRRTQRGPKADRG